MTSDEIQNCERTLGQGIDLAAALEWLQEIAYQLAKQTEQQTESVRLLARSVELTEKNSLGSPVGADSDKSLRGECDRKFRTMLANALRPILTEQSKTAGFSDWLADAIEQQFILIDRDYIDRDADERTTRPDPQAAAIQPQKES
jgi:hypothetical protein